MEPNFVHDMAVGLIHDVAINADVPTDATAMSLDFVRRQVARVFTPEQIKALERHARRHCLNKASRRTHRVSTDSPPKHRGFHARSRAPSESDHANRDHRPVPVPAMPGRST
jgi:hypothetical protein